MKFSPFANGAALKFASVKKEGDRAFIFRRTHKGEEGDRTPPISINGVTKRQKSRVEVKDPTVDKR